MKVVIQRSKKSNVKVNHEVVGSIEKGLVVLVGFHVEDIEEDINYIVKKLINLRIFNDENGTMNLSIKDIKGEILSISQFTLYADTKKGNRPGYSNSMKSDFAKEFYEKFNEKLLMENINVSTGVFGADMDVSISNDGPVTIVIDSKEK